MARPLRKERFFWLPLLEYRETYNIDKIYVNTYNQVNIVFSYLKINKQTNFCIIVWFSQYECEDGYS